MNIQEQEEFEFGWERLWDADACCAAYQLGACVHTESYYNEDAFDFDDFMKEEEL